MLKTLYKSSTSIFHEDFSLNATAICEKLRGGKKDRRCKLILLQVKHKKNQHRTPSKKSNKENALSYFKKKKKSFFLQKKKKGVQL